MTDLLHKKREIVTTTNSVGWRYIRALGEEAVKAAERRAIDEEDDLKGAVLRREAKAARKFLANFLLAVDAMRQADAPEQPLTEDNFFYDVAN